MSLDERAVVLECDKERMVGIIHGAEKATIGVLVIVGGDQYRIGSHRQFLLLARFLASHGVTVMRFDYRGMGDSEGNIRNFENIGRDIREAIDVFFKNSPCLESVILWGLCDAASAAVLYAHNDDRVKGVILLNPWVHTDAGEAKTYLRHYYIRRLFEKEFWKKILHGEFKLRHSFLSILGYIKRSFGSPVRTVYVGDSENISSPNPPLADLMYESLNKFQGKIGIIISGDDLTAAEFQYMVKGSKPWQKMLRAKRVEYHMISKADHTFSKQVWRDNVAECTLRWVLG